MAYNERKSGAFEFLEEDEEEFAMEGEESRGNIEGASGETFEGEAQDGEGMEDVQEAQRHAFGLLEISHGSSSKEVRYFDLLRIL